MCPSASETDAQAAAKRYALSQTARKELPDDIADGLERRFGLSEIESDRLLASTSLEVIRNRLELYLRTTGEMTLDRKSTRLNSSHP